MKRVEVARGVERTKALLHDTSGRFVAQRTVVGPPEFLEHEGKRYELSDLENGQAKYVEARV